MRAAVIDRRGGPEVVLARSQPDPAPGAGELLVRVEAAAVNPVDVKTRSGYLSDIELRFPSILGWDVSGTVVEVGDGVGGWSIGDQVVAVIAQPVRAQGTYAELVAAPAYLFAPAPTSVRLGDAAAVPLAAVTAWQALDKLPVGPGRLLVTGGVGAVGGFAVQIARMRGWAVAALVRAGCDEALAFELGAERVFVGAAGLNRPQFDAVLDTAGVGAAIDAVRDGGGFVSIEDGIQPLPQRGIDPRKSYVNEDAGQLTSIVAMIDRGELAVRIAQRYPLDSAAEAHVRVEAGGTRGKVLLVP